MSSDTTNGTPASTGAIAAGEGPDHVIQTGTVNIRSVGLTVLTVLAIVFLLRYAQELFIPAVLAILFAYALNPLVTWITWLRIPRVLAAAIVLIAVVCGIAFGLYAMRRQASAAIESLPDAALKLRQKMAELRQAPTESASAISKIQKAAAELEKTAAEASGGPKPTPKGVTRVQIDEPAFRADVYLWSGSVGLLGLLSQSVMVLFLVYFILASGDLFKRKLVRIIGTRLSEKRVTLEAINEINLQIERFLLIQVLTSVLVGVCTALALWGFGVKQPAVWGMAAGLFNSIPYFGAILVSAGLGLIAFLQFASLTAALQVAGAALAITSLEGYLLTPALMGRAAQINGVAMFLGLLFWSWLWGTIGLIVAVPLLMVVKSVCDRIESLQPIGDLLGDRERTPKEAAPAQA